MADVDMADAPSTSTAPAKRVASRAIAGEGGDGKKRFEVKKVRYHGHQPGEPKAKLVTVERGSSVGLGYRRR